MCRTHQKRCPGKPANLGLGPDFEFACVDGPPCVLFSLSFVSMDYDVLVLVSLWFRVVLASSKDGKAGGA